MNKRVVFWMSLVCIQIFGCDSNSTTDDSTNNTEWQSRSLSAECALQSTVIAGEAVWETPQLVVFHLRSCHVGGLELVDLWINGFGAGVTISSETEGILPVDLRFFSTPGIITAGSEFQLVVDIGEYPEGVPAGGEILMKVMSDEEGHIREAIKIPSGLGPR